MVTADALHTQTATAQWIISHGADYLLTVKNNQPSLRAKLKALPWAEIPAVTGWTPLTGAGCGAPSRP
ncbi:MAG: hypothetical protein Q4A20_01430 [Actinomyces sp.]|nr:hypothetical protein [Actinomyces sp.]